MEEEQSGWMLLNPRHEMKAQGCDLQVSRRLGFLFWPVLPVNGRVECDSPCWLQARARFSREQPAWRQNMEPWRLDVVKAKRLPSVVTEPKPKVFSTPLSYVCLIYWQFT